MKTGRKLKYSFEHVNSIFNSAKCQLKIEKDQYYNSNQRVEYVCSCGNISATRISSFIKGGKGCVKCRSKRSVNYKKIPVEEVIAFFEKEGCKMIGEYKTANRPVEYICKCGNKSKTQFSQFKRGVRCKKCQKQRMAESRLAKNTSLIKDLSGTKMGSFTVLEFSRRGGKNGGKGNKNYWKCLCDICKNISIIQLRNQRCPFCKRNYDKRFCVGEIDSLYYNLLKSRARERDLEFFVSIEYLWNLFLKQNKKCSLSGVNIYFNKKFRENRLHGTCSLDRIDSSKGYIEGNVQWVHRDLNVSKLDFSQKEFINFCKKVSLNYSDYKENPEDPSPKLDFKLSDKIHNLVIIKPKIFKDERGENFEAFNLNKYTNVFRSLDNFSVESKFQVDSTSYSSLGVLRGFHGDYDNFKLVTCLVGEIFLAVIDLNPDSPTFNNYETIRLDSTERLQVLIPKMCVNAHQCISKNCIFHYKLSDNYVEQENQITLKWNDPKYNIDWPIKNAILSDRDK